MMDRQQAGVLVAVALVTYSDEEKEGSLSFPFRPLSHFFPLLSHCFSFYPPFPLFIHCHEQKPDHWYAADVMVAIVTEPFQLHGAAKTVGSVKK